MLVLALAPSSFAQVNLQAFGNPSAQEVATNRTAQTADPTSAGAGLLISGSAIATAPVTQTSLFVDYPAVVTSGTTVPAGDPVRIEGATGLFAGVTISSINFGTGVVEITLPGCLPSPPNPPGTGCVTPTVGDPNGTGSFRLVGVRNDVNGATAPVNATLSLNSSSNNYILSTTSVPVINALGAGIASSAVGVRSGTNTGTAGLLTTGGVPDGLAAIIVTEGFAGAWRTSVQSSTQSAGATPNGTQLRVTFAGVPSGVSIALNTGNSSGTLSTDGSCSTTDFSGCPTLSVGTINSTALTTVVSLGATSMTSTEVLQLNMTFSSSSTSLAPGAVTATVTMFPIGADLGGNRAPTAADGYPKFAAADVGPVTVANIVPATSTLLVPFAVRDGGFDTGIALANTTADPFGGAGSGGATPAAGTIRLDFYPRVSTGGAGTTFSLTTSATSRPGIGLSADGNLAAGGTWTVLLSELLTAAGQTGSFTGYIFITTSFLNAHGAPFVSDFRNFTSFSPMLILPPPLSFPRSTGVGFESLGL
jgi:hypothetical protein